MVLDGNMAEEKQRQVALNKEWFTIKEKKEKIELDEEKWYRTTNYIAIDGCFTDDK